MNAHVQVAHEGGVQSLRIARPEKKNALNLAMYDALAEALEGGHRAEEVSVHLILGSDGMFTAGNDIQDFVAMVESGGLGLPILRFLRALAATGKPAVAAVDGLAVGIGTTLLLHCDLVYASPAALFRTPFLDLGLVPEAASTLLAPRRMGHARAFELLCLGSAFDAERAAAAGLVNRIVPADRLEEAAREAAHALAAKPREALQVSRALMRGDAAEVLARIDEEAEAFRARLASPEAKAGFAAFLARSAPAAQPA